MNRSMLDRLQLDLYLLGRAVQQRDGGQGGPQIRISISDEDGNLLTPGRIVPAAALWDLDRAVRQARTNAETTLPLPGAIPSGVVDLRSLQGGRS